MCSMSSFTETTGFMSPHKAGCGAAAGGCDEFADEQAELPAVRAASVQATTIVRHRLEGMYGENTTVVAPARQYVASGFSRTSPVRLNEDATYASNSLPAPSRCTTKRRPSRGR